MAPNSLMALISVDGKFCQKSIPIVLEVANSQLQVRAVYTLVFLHLAAS